MENQNLNILDEVNKGATMGMDAISYVSEKVKDNDFKEVFYNYFNVAPILEEESGTYADKEASLHTTTITWNHPISEVLNALISNGLVINCFNEFDYSPYNCFNQTEEFDSEGSEKKFRIKHLENKIPMVYSLSATKK